MKFHLTLCTAEDRMLMLFWIPILLREFTLSPMTLSSKLTTYLSH